MIKRVFSIACSMFLTFYCCVNVVGCRENPHTEVMQWLKQYPPDTPEFRKSLGDGKKFFAAWEHNGRQIDGAEHALLTILRKGDYAESVVVAALGVVGTEVSVPALREVMGDDSHNLTVRLEAAVSLGSIGGSSAAAALRDTVTSPRHLHLRLTAVYNLARIEDPTAIPIIEAFLETSELSETQKHAVERCLRDLKSLEQ